MIAGLTTTHQFIALLVTMTYQVIFVKIWYDVKLLPICVWDGYLHMILPTFMMLGMGYVGARERIRKDEKLANEFADIKKVLASLSQGVALTVDFSAREEHQKALDKQNNGVPIVFEDLEKTAPELA
mmetsp:Transcript_2382/g.3021  ORF Transcript_2382/g.3021 Transcript_2382/m.3021 type:complete len:127 (+) Transcript_2382:595-975(+)